MATTFVYSSICRRTLGLCLLLAVMNNSIMDVYIQVFVGHVFISLGSIPRDGVTGTWPTVCITF